MRGAPKIGQDSLSSTGTLFINAHGEDGDYEYALDAATLARLVRAAQRALS